MDIKEYIGDKEYRYLLQTHGERPLVCIGINPSKADDKEPDPTMKKVIEYSRRQGFSGVAMINLYPKRATKFKDLPDDIDINLLEKTYK